MLIEKSTDSDQPSFYTEYGYRGAEEVITLKRENNQLREHLKKLKEHYERWKCTK